MEKNHSLQKYQNTPEPNSKHGRGNQSSPPSVSFPVDSESYGITTGSAATAAALAALLSIKGKVSLVNIKTPMGCLDISVKSSQKIDDYSGRASVVKMPYHDPDVTINLEVQAEVRLQDKPDITIIGGEGVGRITKPGLQLPVGEVAINPVPREMIKSNLEDALPPGKGAEVKIIIPEGREIAHRTMNPRLGIVDGISVLGTTGIARSMNSESFEKSKKCQLDVALAEGYRQLVFVPGNIGEKLALKLLDVEYDQIIQMGNLVGYMLDEAKKSNISSLIILGHAGKLVKIAGGIFQTEHRLADGRREIITTHTGLVGGDRQTMEEVFNSNTTEDMMGILEREGLLEKVFNSIALSIQERCQERFDIKPEVLILKMDGTLLNSNHQVKLKTPG
ncbi:cobalt-precorrin-5B (C(1))-methyltransferase CbiD [uncultured Methanobacterium sp.]|uniref:cobalt-precorrin-5B (C(1))-methyltransferase CbiD n=1 Tax=uncultured Methanobacterium sp. TaxID=176306 RepID=UPI002AA79E86|nr:cobalt-precorrin-5B (C(1))-methyltransferase CbiD [uncultured Methanobacterium sp.]